MATRHSELLLHPVRLRIVLAMADRELTTGQLRDRLPDVAAATLYRHVAQLAEGGVLEVVHERQVRGGTERTYRLNEAAASLGPDDAASMTAEEHLAGFMTFVGLLVESFRTYVEADGADPARDGVGYRQAALWLTDEELAALADDLATALRPYLDNVETPERRRSLLTTILIPDRS